ncbi:MAG: putative metal-dependent hydrolase [Gemmatimonas sp.]|nr:putative metal-dependent hydrolase [Gemmatimonas sp.]
MEISDPRYPIGTFQAEVGLDDARRAQLIDDIEALPLRLSAAVAGLSEREWEESYRDGGWTVRQLVHHVADSHLNAYMRFRLALTEETPAIKPYLEARWAELPDVAITPPEVSLALLESLHRRWVDLLRALPASEYSRELHHPEMGENVSLEAMLGLYSWHGRHHVAHVEVLRLRLVEQPDVPLA